MLGCFHISLFFICQCNLAIFTIESTRNFKQVATAGQNYVRLASQSERGYSRWPYDLTEQCMLKKRAIAKCSIATGDGLSSSKGQDFW